MGKKRTPRIVEEPLDARGLALFEGQRIQVRALVEEPFVLARRREPGVTTAPQMLLYSIVNRHQGIAFDHLWVDAPPFWEALGTAIKGQHIQFTALVTRYEKKHKQRSPVYVEAFQLVDPQNIVIVPEENTTP